MGLGNALWSATGGGGNQQPNASQVSRLLVQCGVALNATPGTLLSPGDINGIRAIGGPLAEALAFRQVPGLPTYGVAINASSDGAISAVTVSGSGNATMAVAAAPHVPVVAKITTGGVLGTAAVSFNVNNAGFGASTVMTGGAGPFTIMVPGTFVRYSFPAGTYILAATYSVGITSTTVTNSGGGPTATITASPLDYYEFALNVATSGIWNVGQFGCSPDGGGGSTGGGSTLPGLNLAATGVIPIPGTGVVLTVGQHSILITITTPGALGTAIYSYAVDGGSTVTAQATTPNSGSNYVVTIPSTGVTLTFVPGTYVNSSTYTFGVLGGTATLGGGAINTITQVWAGLQATDAWTFFCAPPSHSTSDENTALAALQNVRNVQFAGVHVITMPVTAASAVSAQATLDSSMQTAFGNLLNWDAWCECPSAAANVSGLGDIVVSGGIAIRDTADTDTVVAAARGSDTNRTGLHASSYRLVSPLTGWKLLRPTGWVAAHRYVRTDPSVDLAAVASGPLPIFIPAGSLTIGRDESVTPALDNVQINTLRTYPNMPNQAYFSITSGGGGWKKTTQQASWQPANWVRVLNTFLSQLQPIAQQLMGANAVTNADGTIEEHQRRDWTAMLDSAGKRAVGLQPGGPYQNRQASAANVIVSPSSQLGVSPKQLINNYFLQLLGEVTSEQNNAFFGGLLPAS